MVTMWNYRGDHRPLWAVIATIVASYVAALRLARWGEPWEWVLAAQPIAVLLLWFLLAGGTVRQLGFPAAARRRSTADGPAGALVAAAVAAAAIGLSAAALLAAEATVAVGSFDAQSALRAGAWAVVIGVFAGALPEELVYRGALLRLAQQRWRPRAVIGVTGGLFAFGHLPLLLTTGGGSWEWLGARVAELLVLGLVLGWAAVRTGAIWVPLGWHIGSSLVGVFVLQVWSTQTASVWAAAAAAILGHLLLVPTVLVLERIGVRRRAAAPGSSSG